MRYDVLGTGIPRVHGADRASSAAAAGSRASSSSTRSRSARTSPTTQFYSGDAYYRGVLDLGYLFEDDSLALVDHKTGARIPGIVDHRPARGLRGARRGRVPPRASGSGSACTGSPSARSSGARPCRPDVVIDRLMPDLLDNIEAAALAVDDGPRTNPGSWCDRCSYRERVPREPRDPLRARRVLRG